jgi:hypothetical protein
MQRQAGGLLKVAALLIEKLFERFGQHLETKGYIARGGQVVDATIVPVPKQRNSRDDDEVKAGKTPSSVGSQRASAGLSPDNSGACTKTHDRYRPATSNRDISAYISARQGSPNRSTFHRDPLAVLRR